MPSAPSQAGTPMMSNAGKGAGPKGGSNGGKGGGGNGGKGSPAQAMLAPQPSLKVGLGPDDPPPYGDLRYSTAYWDARHAAVGDMPFDWYMGYDRLAGILRQRLPPVSSGAEILDLGFGTSEVAACLHADGWTNVTAVDTSVVAVTRARSARRHRARTELQFLQMDACKMEFPEECFDAVIDKALLDTLVTGGHSFPRARDMLSEVYRLLRPGGVFFCVSHAAVATRLPYLAHDTSKPWRIEVVRVAKTRIQEEGIPDDELPDDAGGGYFHIYICTKPPIPNADAYGEDGPLQDGDDISEEHEDAESGGMSPEMPASSTMMGMEAKPVDAYAEGPTYDDEAGESLAGPAALATDDNRLEQAGPPASSEAIVDDIGNLGDDAGYGGLGEDLGGLGDDALGGDDLGAIPDGDAF